MTNLTLNRCPHCSSPAKWYGTIDAQWVECTRCGVGTEPTADMDARPELVWNAMADEQREEWLEHH